MKVKLSVTCMFLSFSIAGFAQGYKPAVFTDAGRAEKIAAAFPAIAKMYEDYAAKNHIPGLVYGIVLDGKILHTGQIGYTDIASKTAAGPASDFRIASMSKSFTAMAILKLRDEGKLKLDDPIRMYVAEMQQTQPLTKDAHEVTIRHLLTHAAGYPEDNPWGDRQLASSDEELLAIYKNGLSFSNDPGLGYEYSNLGFATLGYIIKKVSGIPYQQYINDNILKPLGMTNTYWEYTKVPPAQLAHGYRWIDSKWIEQPMLHDGAYGAMGGLITTIEDFSKYMAFQLSAWPARDDQETGPVKRSSVREMQYPWNIYSMNTTAISNGKACPQVNAYAYGLRWTKDCENRVYVGHTGGLPGFGSQWNIMPEYGIGIVSFANATYARAAVINGRVLDTLLSISGITSRQLPASDILDQRKNELLKLLPDWKNAEKSGIFAQNFFMDYFSAELKKESISIYSAAGKIKSVHELVAENQLRGYCILEGEEANIKVSFTLTPQNPALIQEYHLQLLTK